MHTKHTIPCSRWQLALFAFGEQLALCKQRNGRKILREVRNSPQLPSNEPFKKKKKNNNATSPRTTTSPKKQQLISSDFNPALLALHFPDNPKLIWIFDGRWGVWSCTILKDFWMSAYKGTSIQVPIWSFGTTAFCENLISWWLPSNQQRDSVWITSHLITFFSRSPTGHVYSSRSWH